MNHLFSNLKSWKTVVWVVVVAYAALVLTLAFHPSVQAGEHGVNIQLLSQRLNFLKTLKDPLQKDRVCIPLSAMCRSIDMKLPPEVKVYLFDMQGIENAKKLGYYFFMSYYLFPRDVHLSLPGESMFTMGQWTESAQPVTDDILADNGYHISIVFEDNGQVRAKQHNPFVARDPNTVRCGKPLDPFFAFLLPLVAAVSCGWFIQFLFPGLEKEIGPGENFAGGLMLGCVFISFAVLALRLLGIKAELPIFWLMLLLSVVRLFLYFKNNPVDWSLAAKKVCKLEYLMLCPLAVLFYYLFSLASGLESILEFDAIGAWALKAKILYHATGAELLKWFAAVPLSHAHMEYPPLVPALHAMTFGVVGSTNDFVMKFWPMWMLAALVWGLLSVLGWPSKNRFLAVAVVCTVAFLPRSIQFARMEGGVIPMLLFLSLGLVQCALGLAKGNRNRFLFGLMFLFGAAMSKPDGFIFVLFWVGAALITKSGRRMVRPDRRLAVLCVVCVVAVLPFKYLRSQVPVLHPQAKWAESAMSSPQIVLSNTPYVASIIILRAFMDDKFMNWDLDDEKTLVWKGKWDGASSLIQKYNWGYAWMVLFLGVMLLVSGRGRRYSAFVLLGVFFGYQLLLGVVYSAFERSVVDVKFAVSMTGAQTGGRYMFPLVVAVGVALMVLIFRDDLESENAFGATD